MLVKSLVIDDDQHSLPLTFEHEHEHRFAEHEIPFPSPFKGRLVNNFGISMQSRGTLHPGEEENE